MKSEIWFKKWKDVNSWFGLFQEDPPAGVSGAPCDNNIMQWNAVIFGPAETPFEDGTFKLTISKLARFLVAWVVLEAAMFLYHERATNHQ